MPKAPLSPKDRSCQACGEVLLRVDGRLACPTCTESAEEPLFIALVALVAK
jgi:hypothetical protein